MAEWNAPLPDEAVEGELTHIEDHNAIVAAIEEVRSNVDSVEGAVTEIVVLTQAAFDALTPDPGAVYIIKEG